MNNMDKLNYKYLLKLLYSINNNKQSNAKNSISKMNKLFLMKVQIPQPMIFYNHH